MMPPPRMVWPPNTLTPSRCAFESRPFLEEPKPFLCAIALPLSRRPQARRSQIEILSLEALAVGQDLVDFDLNEVLPVALHLLVLLLALELEDQDLLAAAFANDGGEYLCAGQVGLKLALFAADGEDVGELDCAVLVGSGLNLQLLAWRDQVLFAAGA